MKPTRQVSLELRIKWLTMKRKELTNEIVKLRVQLQEFRV